MFSFLTGTSRPTSTRTDKSESAVPKYVLPPAPPHLARYKKIATNPAETSLVRSYETTRKDKARTGQDKLTVGAEIKTLQRAKLPVERKIASLQKQKRVYEGKIAACNLRNAGYSSEVRGLAVQDKELCEREQIIKTEIGFDKLVADETRLENQKYKLQDDKKSLEKERAALDRKINKLESEIELANKDKASSAQKEGELKTQKEELGKQLDELTAPLQELKDKLSGLEGEEKELKSRKSYLLDKIDDYKKEEQSSRRDRNRHSESSRPVGERKAGRERELAKVEQSLRELNSRIIDCEDALDPQQKQFSELKKTQDGVKRKLADCRKDMSDCDNEVADAEKSLRKERKARGMCQDKLTPLYDRLTDVCEKLEQLEAHFESLNNGPLKEVRQGLDSVKARYKACAISRKEQHDMRKILETLEQHQVEVGKLDVAMSTQQKKLVSLQKDEDARLLTIDTMQLKMDEIQQSLRDISSNMKQQLEERTRMAATRGLESAPASSRRSYVPAYTAAEEIPSPTYDDAATRNYRWSGLTLSGLEFSVSGIDATPPEIVQAVRDNPYGLHHIKISTSSESRSFMVYGPHQRVGYLGQLPDKTDFSVPEGMPYFYLYEIERTTFVTVSPQDSRGRAEASSSTSGTPYAAHGGTTSDTYWNTRDANPNAYTNTYPNTGADSYTSSAGYAGQYAGADSSYTAQDTYATENATPPYHTESGSANFGNTGAGASTSYPTSSARSAPAADTPRQAANTWDTGVRLKPNGRSHGLEWIGALNEHNIPPSVLSHFAAHPDDKSCLIRAYPGFCAFAEFDGQPRNLYIIVRPRLRTSFPVENYPAKLVLPDNMPSYFVTEVPADAASGGADADEPASAGKGKGPERSYRRRVPSPYVESDSESDSDSDDDIRYRQHTRSTPRPGPIPRARTDDFRRSYRDASPPRRSYTSNFSGGRDFPHDIPRTTPRTERRDPPPASGRRFYPEDSERDRSSGNTSNNTGGGSARPSERSGEFRDSGGFPGGGYQQGTGTDPGSNGNNSRYDQRQSGPGQEGERFGTTAPDMSQEAAPSIEQVFLQRKVKPLPFTGKQIDLTDFKERRLSPEELKSKISDPLKNSGLTQDQLHTLIEGLTLLLNDSGSDMGKIPDLPRLFAEYVAEEKRSLKPIRSERELTPDQQRDLQETYQTDARDRLSDALKAGEAAALERKFPGTSEEAKSKRQALLSDFAADLLRYFEIEDGGDSRGASQDATGKDIQKRPLSRERKRELEKLVDRAGRDPAARQTDVHRREILTKKINAFNRAAQDGIDGKVLDFAKSYLGHLYQHVFNADLSDIAGNSVVRINILKLRGKLRD